MPEQRDLFGATSSAVLSPCGLYRYRLGRRWAPGGTVCWILLNPSTAGAVKDDPTIRRCVGFAKRWGCGAIEVVNLFALRSPDPRSLFRGPDPIGPENDAHIMGSVTSGDIVVCAWGALGRLFGRGHEVQHMLTFARLKCLGETKSGQPRHPLYLRADAQLVKWDGSHA